RLVVWRPASPDGGNGAREWERIGNVARGEIAVSHGLGSTAATLIRARETGGGLLGRLLGRLGAGKGRRTYELPGGVTVEQVGERSTDGLLVWLEDPSDTIDEERLRTRWPETRRCQRLGPRLFLVEGVGAKASSTTVAAPPPEPDDASPRKQAEEALATARSKGDRMAEAAALTDLGIILLNEGDPRGAVGLLEPALALAREFGDVEREADVMGNLGMAMLHLQQPDRARQLFEQELAHGRSRGDVMAEKIAMEHMGLFTAMVRNPRGALEWFARALELARSVGDKHQEANLLWLEAINLAELDRRDEAIARGQEAIALFGRLGKPQAGWYGAYLQKYRMGLFDNEPMPAAPGVARGPESFLGGSLTAGALAAQAPAQANPKGTTGPGLLRMALTATRAMAQFAGSGFQTTPPDVRQRRLQVCSTCEHHTGVRCKICGCFTSAKSRLLQESCPIGKWPG
ncbi:MAG: tetratricopeptide repeat protein, partial [Isosphaeraceae bacterium]